MTNKNYCDCRQGRDPCTCKAVDPVPPAGVDGFDLALKIREALDRKACPDAWMRIAVEASRPLFDGLISNVTRLQAEVERLGKRVEEEVATAVSNELKSEREVFALQSELTKARELLEHAPWVNWVSWARDTRAYLSNQSAPADKGQGEPVARVRHSPVRKRLSVELLRSNMKDGDLLYAEQPAPVAVVMPFDFEHPLSKERRTVTLKKRDVFDGMEDYFYDKLSEQICQCESVGETNVVDCNCDEYVHDFEIVEACLEEVGRLNSEPKP